MYTIKRIDDGKYWSNHEDKAVSSLQKCQIWMDIHKPTIILEDNKLWEVIEIDIDADNTLIEVDDKDYWMI